MPPDLISPDKDVHIHWIITQNCGAKLKEPTAPTHSQQEFNAPEIRVKICDEIVEWKTIEEFRVQRSDATVEQNTVEEI